MTNLDQITITDIKKRILELGNGDIKDIKHWIEVELLSRKLNGVQKP